MVNPEDRFDICDQRSAILECVGHALVLGGPGSGKTTIGLLRARRTVLGNLKPEQSVLFLSFSNAAIRRILESTAGVLSPDIRRRVQIRTYHSFAWDILRSHGYLVSSKRRLTVVSAEDAAVIRAGLSDQEWATEEERLFVEDGRTTYDQFAARAACILEGSARVRERFSSAFPLILVDEFQDTDDDQWRLVRALAENTQIIALGDREQRIYEWRNGVSAGRLRAFAECLDATTFDFQRENNRSPAAGIAGYAHSLLDARVQLKRPDDVEFRRFGPGRLAVGLRFAVSRAWQESVRRTGGRAPSIVIAARSRAMVRLVSDALTKKVTIRGKEYGEVRHDVMFDQSQIVLAARVIAFVMETEMDSVEERIAGGLSRISAVYRCGGTKTGIATSKRLVRWSERCENGATPNTNCVKALRAVLGALNVTGFRGAPTEDWLAVRRAFEGAGAEELRTTGGHARYLRLLRRGSVIEERLGEIWKEQGNYRGAETALKEAVVQDQIMDNHREMSGISVMTMHQLKGREYDAVVLVEDRHRTFRGRENEPPYAETRRLLQVALTRARHFVFVLGEKKNATLDVLFDK